MTSTEIRNSFLKYFDERGHTIVPSSPVVPFDDPTLLFTNAGMNQFKDVFLGTGTRAYRRAANTQKCIRVSGKHNDLEEVGRDTYHHTFFEMLGNWSFGDYYKEEAIAWAWDLLTNVWGLPKNRLWATIYKEDDESGNLWQKVTDIDHGHILKFDEKDNFWEMGETGPCGPCSEIHYDTTLEGHAPASLVNAGRPDVMEVWNLVFIQYNRDEHGTLHPLPARHVDTGMGFERMCAVLQGKISNYDTDVFTPLIRRISDLTRHPYDGRLTPGLSKAQADMDIAMRVIADHVRTLTFAVADGAAPANEGRGYVLRRILRRASRFGRNLGMHEPFIHRLVPTIVESMSYIFPEVHAQSDHVQKVIKGEEESFNATLDRGLEIFEEVAGKAVRTTSRTIAGDDVFRLYDTFGFPSDLTALLARERDLSIDEGGFARRMEEQRGRSRVSGKGGGTAVGSKFSLGTPTAKPTEFVGYDALQEKANVLGVHGGFVILDRTPFYAESGGQVGDTGSLALGGTTVEVLDTQKDNNVFGHRVEPSPGIQPGAEVRALVDEGRRSSIMRNHTATHLVHASLRAILGTHVHQAGSLVAPDHLRFDFAHTGKVTDEELAAVERLVNEKVDENISLTHHRNIPFGQAQKMGALMFFGDKYGDRVNVVEFGAFSREFCGGTHVRTTGEIGFFKFRAEGSVASGVRRIEAVTGDHALELLKLQHRNFFEQLEHALEQLDGAFGLLDSLPKEAGAAALKARESLAVFGRRLDALKQAPPLPSRTGKELDAQFRHQATRTRDLESIILSIADIRKNADKENSRQRVQSLSGTLDAVIRRSASVNGFKVAASRVSAASVDELKTLGDALRGKLGSGVGLLAAVIDDKVSLVCVVTDDLVAAKKAEAGKIVGAVAKLLGGGGGGRPHLATAGGKDVARLDEALAQTTSIVESLLRT